MSEVEVSGNRFANWYRKHGTATNIFMNLAAGVAIGTSVVSFGLAVWQLSEAPEQARRTIVAGTIEPNGPGGLVHSRFDPQSDLIIMQRELSKISDTQAELQRQFASDDRDPELRQLALQLKGIEERQTRIETALQADPMRALEVPMLKRDIDNLRENSKQNFEAIRESITQVHELSKWLIGAIAGGMLTIALFLFGRKREASAPKRK